MSALGLGFLLSDAASFPRAPVALAITLTGLVFGFRAHRRPWALLLGTVSAVAIVVFTFGVHTPAGTRWALAALVASSVLNAVFHRRAARRKPA